MSIAIVYPSKIQGTLKTPSSKSYAQRAVAAALLNNGKTIITNYGNSNDEKAALGIIKQLGADVVTENGKLIINSLFNTNNIYSKKVFVGESGLALRLFTTIVSLLKYEIEITGEGSLLNRPIDVFEKILPELRVDLETNNGKLPIKIKGSLVAKNIEIDGEMSSQFLSGFLFAYSFLFSQNLQQNDIAITVNNLKSKPYIDVTIDVLKAFALPIPTHNNYIEFVFCKNDYKSKTEVIYNIEGDWSNAAFLLVAGAIAGKLCLKNINLQSKQADKKIIEVLQNCGCKLIFGVDEIIIEKSIETLTSFSFDATDCPDLFPPLVALAANCKGISTIKGVERLKHKESNRGEVLQKEFAKLGVEIFINNDEMKIAGISVITGATVHSNNDHRIAMACAIAALHATDKVVIENTEAVNKSYPNFFEDLKSIGASISY